MNTVHTLNGRPVSGVRAADHDLELVAAAGDGFVRTPTRRGQDTHRAAGEARQAAARELDDRRLVAALVAGRFWEGEQQRAAQTSGDRAPYYRVRDTRRVLLLEGRHRFFFVALGQLAEAATMGQLVGIRARYGSPDTDEGTNAAGILREPVWASEHDALFALREAELEDAVPQDRPSVIARRAVPYREDGRRRGRGRKVKVRGGVL